MGSAIFKKPPLKKLKKDGYFGVDMHFHTNYSLDAVSKIELAVKKAEKKGFGFAITDHNTVKGVMASYRIRKHALIIPGIEVTCKNGNHVLAYFHCHKELEEFYNKKIKPLKKTNPFFVNISLKRFQEICKDYNCFVGAAHPYAPGAVGLMNTNPTKTVEQNMDMIEVINGYNLRQSNMKALYWAAKLNKGFTGGSDAHSVLELGRVLTFTQADEIEQIFKDIMTRKSIVVGTEDNLFLKAVMGIRKESEYVKRSGDNHMARQLIKSQLGTEYRYMKEKFMHGRAYHMLARHHQHMMKNGLKSPRKKQE